MERQEVWKQQEEIPKGFLSSQQQRNGDLILLGWKKMGLLD